MCGKEVLVYDEKDRRESFCSRECEHVYWKHSSIYAKQGSGSTEHANRGMSGGMSLGSLIRRERRDME